MLTVITTPNAPQAIGPYVQGVTAGGFLFASGQIPLNPAVNKVTATDTVSQTRQVLENLKAILHAANGTWDQVVKVTVYLKDLNDFEAMNGVYSSFFERHRPARVCVEVARLPRDVRVEMDLIAFVGGRS